MRQGATLRQNLNLFAPVVYLFLLDTNPASSGSYIQMPVFLRAIILLLLLASAGLAAAQPGPVIAPAPTLFRIGYIRQDPESVTSSAIFQKLRDFLVNQPEIRQQMQVDGVADIIAQSFDSHRLLVEAMDAEQIDLAFCSVIDFGFQRGSYEPVFQIRRPGDPHSSSGNRRAWHSGVIFVNSRSPLFDLPTTVAVQRLPEYLQNQEMAMVGSSSAAGYVYPFLALDRISSEPVTRLRSVFWQSSTEVVKAVVNGIHEVGACDAMAIDEVLKGSDLLPYKDKLLKEILRTDPVPRDPVVIHTRWLITDAFEPRDSAELGRRILRGVAGFFGSDPTLPRLDRTSPEAYKEVMDNVQRFQQLR